MTDREKLVGLLDIIIQPGEKTLGEIADHLLSNGVTFAPDKNDGSKWISVSERLPEPKLNVLVYGVSGCSETSSVHSGYTRGIDEGWFTWEDSKLISNVTHWLPLPEVPKEDERWG